MLLKKTLITITALLICRSLKADIPSAGAQEYTKSAYALIQRVMKADAKYFKVEITSKPGADDVFGLESKNGKIILRGNNAVSVASALNYYLTNYAHCQITWNAVNMQVPHPLPVVPAKITRNSPYKYRYYLNYCTFNYTMSWWNWDRWQWEIDWMAMNGINMPLALVGENAIWKRVYNQMGFSDKDLESFFSGPAYFGWFWMGNLDGWGGPLPQSWIQSHEALQKQILARERSLGMTPILPAFSGHVPPGLQAKFPDAKIKKTKWNANFPEVNVLDPEDPLFTQIGAAFVREQTKTYGTDHYYSADTFNENDPPSSDSTYLDHISKKVYQSMAQVDPEAKWIMQGWLFYHSAKFWQPTQIKALLNAVPNDNLIILDLISEVKPIWTSTNAYYGKPWIWNMLHNFGGNISMFGRLKTIATLPAETMHNTAARNLQGIGLTPEAIEQNPVVYQLMMDNVWRNKPIDLDTWLKQYARNRYGKADKDMDAAWKILENTAYNSTTVVRDGPESIITGRPTFDKATRWTRTAMHYNPKDLLPAWDLMVKASPRLKQSQGFEYDIVDVSRQVLANYGGWLQGKFAAAYKAKNMDDFNKYSQEFLALIADMDRLVATQKCYLLGDWLQAAKSWAGSPQEQALYEFNARDLITLWGDKNSDLHEYACRQWSGLLNNFYRERWRMFFADVNSAAKAGKNFDEKQFENKIKDWEWNWVNAREIYPTTTTGNAVEVSKQMHNKYAAHIAASYK